MSSVKKCLIFTKRFFERSTKLSAIVNKSRLFNTYESLYEVGCIVFYNSISSRLNQVSLQVNYTLICVLAIIG